jgi:VanZ family protein
MDGLNSRRLAVATLVGYVSFIVYQSLADGGAWHCGGAVLSASARLSRSDLLANVLAYVPVGVLFVLACPAVRTRAGGTHSLRLVAGALSIAGLSLLMELLQGCQAARVSSAYDWAANVGGGVAGLALGVLLRRAARVQAARDVLSVHGADTWLRLLTVAVPVGWLLSQTMPWVFAVDVGTIRSNLSFLRGWGDDVPLDLWRVARHAGAWAAIVCAWRLAADDPRVPSGGAVTTGVASLGLQLLLDTGAPLSFEELAGMGAMVVTLPLSWRAGTRRPGPWAVGLFCGALVSVGAYELRPEPLASAATQAFSLWPRVGLGGLKGAIDYALLFGWFGVAAVIAAQWAGSAGHSGARYVWPGAAVVMMLVFELAQTRIPGRGPDLSAPLFTLLAVLAATTIVTHQPPRR